VLAVFDIGNTRVGVGVFEGPRLRSAFNLATDVRRPAEEYAALLSAILAEEGLRANQVKGAALASVVPPLTEAFERLCTRLFGCAPLVVDAGARTGIRVATRNPREVGPDRVLNAVAAYHLYGGPAIVVDFGTATTFDVVGDDGAYLGSVIAPGLLISAEALFQHTSRLQRVELARPKAVLGKDTASALQSGLLYGHVAMVEGMLSRLQAETGESQVVATGELAPLLVRQTSAIDRLEPNLSLIGLRLLYELNRTKKDERKTKATVILSEAKDQGPKPPDSSLGSE
jgi:type III pantothenate kinase